VRIGVISKKERYWSTRRILKAIVEYAIEKEKAGV